MGKINKQILKDLTNHGSKISFARKFQSIGYERCAELPLIISKIEPFFSKKISYLDIGSGTSILPSYIFKKTESVINRTLLGCANSLASWPS